MAGSYPDRAHSAADEPTHGKHGMRSTPRGSWHLVALAVLALAIAVVAVPHSVPGLVVPGSHGAMSSMNAMH